jgi:hypothetical protein
MITKRLTIWSEKTFKYLVRNVKAGLLVIILTFLLTECYAVSFKVPFRCNKPLLIERFKERGIILDEDDPQSHGWIDNKGSYYFIYTYVRPEDLEPFIKIPLEVQHELSNG